MPPRSRKAPAPASSTPPRVGPAPAPDADAEFLTMGTPPPAAKKHKFQPDFVIACEHTVYPPGSKHGAPGERTGGFTCTLDPTPKFNTKAASGQPFNNNQACKDGILIGCLSETCT